VSLPEFLQPAILLIEFFPVVRWRISPTSGKVEELNGSGGCIVKLAVAADMCLHSNEFVFNSSFVGSAVSAVGYRVETYIRRQKL